jgi:hypothetical protein
VRYILKAAAKLTEWKTKGRRCTKKEKEGRKPEEEKK